jgi:hypothetical protein
MNMARALAGIAAGFVGGVGGMAVTALGAGLLSEAIDLDAHSTIMFLSLALGIPLGSVIGLRVVSAMFLHPGSPPPRRRLLAGLLAFVIAAGGIIMLLVSNRAGEAVVAALCLTALEMGVIYASKGRDQAC